MRISDWSSDVCSSDLRGAPQQGPASPVAVGPRGDGHGQEHADAYGGEGVALGPLAHAELVGGVGEGLGDEGAEVAADHRQGCQRRQGRTRLAVEHLRWRPPRAAPRAEEHTSELQSLMRISYAAFCLKKKTKKNKHHIILYQ